MNHSNRATLATQATREFMKARDFLIKYRNDYDYAYSEFRWPVLDKFNWALDWFDVYAQGNSKVALHIISDASERKITFAEMSESSHRVAAGFLKLGIQRGDRILMMLGNRVALWQAVLAAQKIGAVVVPTATQATPSDLEDRLRRGTVKLILSEPLYAEKFDRLPDTAHLIKVVDGKAQPGWVSFDVLLSEELTQKSLVILGETKATDPFLLYFTSGTATQPKLVLHTHESYPVGHLSTMYWIGIDENSVHQNISSPGWAKHAWSSFFAPWNAGATILMTDFAKFSPERTLQVLRENEIHSLCAPPTVWRMLIQKNLGLRPRALGELVSAGEPLNAEIISQVQTAWGLTIRDGFGQTETSLQIGNSPGCKVKPGSMGRPMPGFKVSLLDSESAEVSEGEVSLRIDGANRPTCLMQEYVGDEERTRAVISEKYYRTGDEALMDEEGYFYFVGRGDDVFKSSDYRISPFELESVLLENDLVVESAVIPSPDPLRLSVPKAVIILKEGVEPNLETAKIIFAFIKEKLASYKQIRRIEFADLPKTISGKIRRVQLRREEESRVKNGVRGKFEFWREEI